MKENMESSVLKIIRRASRGSELRSKLNKELRLQFGKLPDNQYRVILKTQTQKGQRDV